MEERTLMDDLLNSAKDFDISRNIIAEYSPLSLAFIGDAVFEVYVRTYVLSKGNMPPYKLHIEASNFVKAKSQAVIMHQISEKLTEEELEIARRGRNAKSGTIPKNADITDYKNATGLESLFGYLYLAGNVDRLKVLFEESIKIINKNIFLSM